MRIFRMCIIGIGIDALTAGRPDIMRNGEVASPCFSRPIVNKKNQLMVRPKRERQVTKVGTTIQYFRCRGIFFNILNKYHPSPLNDFWDKNDGSHGVYALGPSFKGRITKSVPASDYVAAVLHIALGGIEFF